MLTIYNPPTKALGNDIDLYMQPLLDELRQLWDDINASEFYISKTFAIKGALIWITYHFPT